MTNPFNWQGPSKIIDTFGRIKTDRQAILDATRVNPESNLGYSTRDDTKTRIIIGKRNEARSQ